MANISVNSLGFKLICFARTRKWRVGSSAQFEKPQEKNNKTRDEEHGKQSRGEQIKDIAKGKERQE